MMKCWVFSLILLPFCYSYSLLFPVALCHALFCLLSGDRKGSSGVTPRFIVSYRDVARLVNYTRITTKESCDDYITIKCHVTYEVNKLFITYCNNYINTSITRNQDGGYNAKFPWKEDSPLLPANYSRCERRTRSMVRCLAATPQLLTTYGNIIAEQEACDFIEKVDDARPTDSAHYIPHHPVRKDPNIVIYSILFGFLALLTL